MLLRLLVLGILEAAAASSFSKTQQRSANDRPSGGTLLYTWCRRVINDKHLPPGVLPFL